MKTVFFLLAVLIAGCAMPQVRYVNSSGAEVSPQTYLECRYEGQKASAGIRSSVEAAYHGEHSEHVP